MLSCLLKFWCDSANTLNANMTSVVDCPTVEPECWGLQYLSSRGWMCGKSICANTFYQYRQNIYRVVPVATVIRLRCVLGFFFTWYIYVYGSHAAGQLLFNSGRLC